jgi:hypothetical protein
MVVVTDANHVENGRNVAKTSSNNWVMISKTGSEASERVASSGGGGGTLDRRWTLAGGSKMGWHFQFLE